MRYGIADMKDDGTVIEKKTEKIWEVPQAICALISTKRLDTRGFRSASRAAKCCVNLL